MSIEEKLRELGLEIPEAPTPLAAYVPAVRTGNLVFTSGQLPFVSGQLMFEGKVGADLTVEDGAEAARTCAMNALAAAESVIESLDQVVRIVKLTGFVQCAPDFIAQAKVINGASELLVAIFGERGKHTRCALGANALPLNAPVEIDLILEVEG